MAHDTHPVPFRGLSFTVPEGASALVTGGSRGIGRAVAVRLAEVGYDIWLNFLENEPAAREVQSEIQGRCGRSCRLLRFDVANPEEVSAALLPLLETSAPHVLVNNAGIVRDGAMVLMPYEDWRRVIGTTLDGFFLVTKCVLQGMIPRRSGRVVNIASTSGQSGLPGQANYAAAKAGLIGATKALALEVARRGILVNAVAPGFIDTDMTREAPIERMLQMVPLSRMGTVDEVAGAVAFLVSDEASYITGQVIACNGGLYT